MDGKRSAQVDNLSKLTKIEELRKKLEEPFEAPPNMQRLFFRGKQVIILLKNICNMSLNRHFILVG